MSAGVSGLFTGMEDILRGVLSAVDGYVPSGEHSHQEILDQASVPVDGVRPAILSSELYDALVALKNFRHFERYNYRFRFNSTFVEENEIRVEGVVPRFEQELEAFFMIMSRASEPDNVAEED